MSVQRNGAPPPTVLHSRGPRLGMLVAYLREEEKLLLAAARARGVTLESIIDRKLIVDVSSGVATGVMKGYDAVLDRCVAHSRAAYALRALEAWGIPTLNHSEATTICDDKALCSLALAAAGVPTPKTLVAFSIESALEACEELGYPAVLKPVTGSWGRLLSKVNGPEQARVIMEQKLELGSFHHGIFYVQEFLEKPGRDIRAFVVGDRVLAASYRTADHWITNTARGAVSVTCPITPQIEEMSLRACEAVGARLAGVDLIETFDGYTVVEVNTGGEFHGLIKTTDVDLAGEIIEEGVRLAKSGELAPPKAPALQLGVPSVRTESEGV
jgi:[lysine-biosynthesis-protein LysW]---L-2-aminoadipate ligase